MRRFRYIFLIAVLFQGLPLQATSPRLSQTAEAARQGDSSSQFTLGTWYYNGEEGLPKDYSQAVVWYRRAAEQGNVRAQMALGLCYCRGEGVPKNIWKGLRLIMLPNGGLPKNSSK